jgi:hypothetical protein
MLRPFEKEGHAVGRGGDAAGPVLEDRDLLVAEPSTTRMTPGGRSSHGVATTLSGDVDTCVGLTHRRSPAPGTDPQQSDMGRSFYGIPVHGLIVGFPICSTQTILRARFHRAGASA